MKKRKKWKYLFIFSQTPVEYILTGKGLLKSLKFCTHGVRGLFLQLLHDYSLTGMFGTKRSLRPTNYEGRETNFLHIGQAHPSLWIRIFSVFWGYFLDFWNFAR